MRFLDGLTAPLFLFEGDEPSGGAATEPAAKPGEGEPPEPKAEATPPWGSDEEFDPKKAWNLIQNLRGDVDKHKTSATEAAAKVKEFEDATKTEQQKLEERASTAEAEKTKAEQSALRLEVALEKAPEGMPVSQIRKLAKRLAGENREEFEADADELFAEFTPAEEGEETPRRPREKLRPGAAPGSEPEETDPRKLAESVPRI